MPAESKQVDAPAFDARVKRRCILFRARGSPLADVISYLCWAIPLAVAIVGASYVLLEQIVLQGHSLSSPHVIRTLLVTSTVAPVLTWLVLTWTKKIGIAEQKVRRELALRHRELAVRNAIGDAASHTLDLAQVLQTALERMVDLMGVQVGEMRLLEGKNLLLKAQCGIAVNVDNENCGPLGHCLCGKCAETGMAMTLRALPAEMSLANTRCIRQGFRSVVSVPMKTKGDVVGVVLLASRKADAIAERDLEMLTAIGQRVAAAVENARLYQELAQRATLLETASLIGQRMSSVLDLDTLMAEIVKLIHLKFGYNHAHILLVDEEARQVVLREACGPSADAIKARGVRLKIGEEGITGWVAYTGQTMVCNDVRREPRYCPVELLPETRAELAVPLRVGTRTIGVLDVQSNQIDTFEKEDVSVLQILGNQIGAAIENARLFQETKQRYDAMAALHETSLDMIAQLDTPVLLESLLRRGAQLVGAQGGALFQYDPLKKLVYAVGGFNTWRNLAGVTFQLGEGVAGTVAVTGQPLIVNDYATWEHRSRAFEETRLTKVIGLPLKWQDQLIGALNFIGYEESRPFDDNDIWLASQFADLAAIAMKNAELHSRISQFNQELEQKVAERTVQLTIAKDEIGVKADQLRSLWAKTIHIQEQERARIALDMHDGVIQLITAARCELKATRTMAHDYLPESAKERFDAARQVLDEIELELRRAIHDLHPPVLAAVGLAPAIEKYVKRFQELSGIVCTLQITGIPRRLPSATEIAVFRIVEESLQNVATHAEAEMATCLLEFGPDTLCVTVEDNGLGLELAKQKKDYTGHGLGLLGMKERIRSLNGRFKIVSEPGRGTRLAFCIPVEDPGH